MNMGTKEIILIIALPLLILLIVRGYGKLTKLKKENSIVDWKYYVYLYVLFLMPVLGAILIEILPNKTQYKSA